MKIISESGEEFQEGDKAFNYYDRKVGIIRNIEHDGWFEFHQDNGHRTTLNGERICSLSFAMKKGWIKK